MERSNQKMQGAGRAVFRAGVAVGLGNLLVNLANLGRDASIATAFGTSVQVDAFFLATMVPIFLLTVGTGAYKNTIVPLLEKVASENGRKRARELIGQVTGVNVPMVCAIGIALAACVPLYAPLVAGSLPETTRSLITTYTWFALPMLVVAGYSNLAEGPLQTQGRFFLPRLISVGLPVGMAFGAIFLGPRLGVIGVCYGGFAGAVAQMILNVFLLTSEGVRVSFGSRIAPDVGAEIKHQFVMLSSGVSIAYVSPLIDQWMASFLGAGSVSTLSYANRLVVGAASLMIGALSAALLPHFSRLVISGNADSLNAQYVTVVRFTLWAGVALSGVVWVLSEPIVVLLYQRGSFVPADSVAVSSIVEWFCLQYPPLWVGTISATLLSAAGLNRVFVPLGVMIALVHALGNLVLMRWFGLAGIAISSAVTYVVSLVTMNSILHKKELIRLPRRLLVDVVVSVAVAGGLAVALVSCSMKPGANPTWPQFFWSALAIVAYCCIAFPFNWQIIRVLRRSTY